jgi:MATE family multidrug resistance protein
MQPVPGLNDPYGNRAIWRIAAPMMLSAVTTPLLGMVHTAVMGHLEEPYYLGAVATGTTLFNVLFMGLNFLRMGTTGVTAQACGAGQGDTVREALGQALLTSVALAVLIIGAQWPIMAAALWLLAPSAEVGAYAREYFEVRVLSAPATLANFVVIGWLLGMQNARGPLAVMLSANFVNIVLALWLVLGLGLRVRGVAFATLIAEFAGLAVGLLFVRRELARFPGHWRLAALRNLGRYRQIFAINGSLLLRTLSLMFVFAFITAQGARMGDVVLAVNAVLMNFQWFLSYALDGIAHAAEALVGKAVGARDRDGMLAAVRRSLAWSVGFAAAFCLAYAAGGTALVDLLTGVPAVRAGAREYLPWLVLLPLISVWSFLYDGVYVGATRSREMLVVMAASAFLVFLPAWYLGRDFGNHALWFAFTLFMLARAVGMHWWFRRLVARGAIVPAVAVS